MPVPPSLRERVDADRKVRRELVSTSVVMPGTPAPPRSDRDVLLEEVDRLASDLRARDHVIDLVRANLDEIIALEPTSDDSDSRRIERHLKSVAVARQARATIGGPPVTSSPFGGE